MSKTVLVTGVSSGIGLALAKSLFESPYNVIATARRDSLAKLTQEVFKNAGERFLLLPLDINQPEERDTVIREANERWGGVDVLINNAGISYRTVVEQMTEADEFLQMQTNFFGPVELMRLVLPGMREKRSGQIINISSVGGMMAMPTMGSYSASKFALEGLSEALWYEMRPWNIDVTLVQVGFVRSNSFENVYLSERARASVERGDAYTVYYREMEGFVARLMNNSRSTPESIAKKVMALIEAKNPPLRIAGTGDAYFFSILRRLFPRRFYHWILYRNLPGVKNWGNES